MQMSDLVKYFFVAIRSDRSLPAQLRRAIGESAAEIRTSVEGEYVVRRIGGPTDHGKLFFSRRNRPGGTTDRLLTARTEGIRADVTGAVGVPASGAPQQPHTRRAGTGVVSRDSKAYS